MEILWKDLISELSSLEKGYTENKKGVMEIIIQKYTSTTHRLEKNSNDLVSTSFLSEILLCQRKTLYKDYYHLTR